MFPNSKQILVFGCSLLLLLFVGTRVGFAQLPPPPPPSKSPPKQPSDNPPKSPNKEANPVPPKSSGTSPPTSPGVPPNKGQGASGGGGGGSSAKSSAVGKDSGTKQPPSAQGKGKKNKEPREVKLTTKDGIVFRSVYLESNKEKEAVPVILIHELKGQGGAFKDLALRLQDDGFAVIYPDLRGHGASAVQKRMNKEITLDPSKIKKNDVIAMIKYELEEIKQFLEKENDDGKLNLNALVVLGVGEGTILGMNWAMNDWSWPSVGKKQGQDVKAMVMITPVKMFEGITSELPAKHPAISRLPTLLIAGNDQEGLEELDKLKKLLEKTRTPTAAESVGPLFVHVEQNKGSGIRLANDRRVIEMIVKFLSENVVAKQEKFPWIRRNQS